MSDSAPDDRRPSPDALLAAAERAGRGRLKVYLGAAPGVGKTYAMLEAARRRQAEGASVLVGVVETHGRAETQALLDGLEVLPRRPIAYRDQTIDEFDLDGALARHPDLILVDELAHTNAPGSRHPKRYQDIEELLAAGIDVATAVNVQHIDSLNDVVAKITRVRVRETVPDAVLERADEVQLVDLTPEELTRRLAEGRVYLPEQAQRAARHFFQPGNLTALRELALRRTAERVDDQMVDYMRANAIDGPWPAGERIMVCIDDSPVAPALVRTGRRLADLMRVPWIAVHVETPGHYQLPDAAKERISAALRLTERLGGDTLRLEGRDIAGELLRYARAHNISQIVVGHARRSGWRAWFSRPLDRALVRQSHAIAIHVVPDAPAERAAGRRAPAWTLTPRLPGFAVSAIGVAGAALAAAALRAIAVVPNSSLALVFLVAVLGSAAGYGLSAGLVAAMLSALVYNFFFIPPLYTFTIAGADEILAYVIYFAAAILTGGLAGRVRDQARDARSRVKTMAALYDFSRKLAATSVLDDLLWAIAYHVATALSCRVVILLPEGGKLSLMSGYPPEDELDAAAWTAAAWAFDRNEPAGRDTETLPRVPWYFAPLRTGKGVVAVIGVQPNDADAALLSEQLKLLDALADQAAVAIERMALIRDMAESRVAAETEKLRVALLSSISHDLRTPLSSIIGAASSLQEDDRGDDPAARAALLATIREEADRLNRFVGNLLDMTRLESGTLALKRDWVDVGDLVATALRRARPQLGARRIDLAVAPDLPLLRIDHVLMEQVLFNLLDNAAKYAPDGSTIRMSARRDGNAITIAVQDEGPGIPADDLEKVFSKFYRILKEDRQPAGTGLGLSICRGLVEAHGGSIVARSPVAAGRGAVFTLRLPVEPTP